MDGAVTPGEKALFSHRFLMRVGLSIGNVFAWIFVFEYAYALLGNLSYALASVAFLYALSQAIELLLAPKAAARLRRGSRGSLMWGAVCTSAAFVFLPVALQSSLPDAALGLMLFAMLFGVGRALYFVPYNLVHANSRVLRPHALYEIIIALMPLFAGLTIAMLPFASLRIFSGAAAFIVLSLVPAFFVRDVHERFSWGYAESFGLLFSRRYRTIVTSSVFDGIQGTALFLVWPIAVFLIVGGSFMALGIIFSITLLAILAVRGVYASILKKVRLEFSAPVQAAVAASHWAMRLVAGSPFAVVGVDTYSYSTLPIRGTSVDPLTFEQLADQGSFIDEYTVLKEMGLALGRIVLSLATGVLAFLGAGIVVFVVALIVAAAAAVAATLIAHRQDNIAY